MLTVEETAQQLGYKVMTVYRKIYLGHIKAKKIGRDVRIDPKENRELFAQRARLMGR